MESTVTERKIEGGTAAAAITAGKFPGHFVGDFPGLYLSIAGPALRNEFFLHPTHEGVEFALRFVVDFLRNAALARERV